MSADDCALWLRVSTADQDYENQRPVLEALAAARGWRIVKTYETVGSAFKASSDRYEAVRQEMMADAHLGQWKHLLVWSLDRLTRRGIEDIFMLLRVLDGAGADVVSAQEPWLNGTDPYVREIMLAFAGLNAKMESQRRSERVKAGIAKRRAAGLPVGGKPGRKDKKPRRKSGYYAAWEDPVVRERHREAAREPKGTG